MPEILQCHAGMMETKGILEKKAFRKVQRLMKRLKEYSPETYEHSAAVSELAGRFGAVLGYPEADIVRLNLAGMLHDVGKLSVPLSVLHKRGCLDAAEWDLMKMHPEAGYKMILPYVNDVAVLLAVRQHHEHMDGSGYPDGISSGITEFAKIIVLADVYDGLTRKRSYRLDEISEVSARKIMLDEQRRYDKAYLDLFFTVVIRNKNEGEKMYV